MWGLNFAIIKLPLAVLPAHTVNGLRMIVAALVLGLVLAVQSRQRGVSFWADVRRAPLSILGLGLLGQVVYQVAFIVGVDRVTAGSSALVMASSPVWTVVMAHALRIDRIGRWAWLAVGVGCVGVVLIVTHQIEGQVGGDLVGVLALLGAAIAWGLYTVLSRPVLDRGVSPTGLATFGIWTSLPFLLTLGVWQAPPGALGIMNGAEWAALVYSGGLSIGISYALWNAAVGKVGPSLTAAFSNLVPVVGVVAGVVVLGERVDALQLLGGALIIGGIVLLRWVRKPKAKVPKPA